MEYQSWLKQIFQDGSVPELPEVEHLRYAAELFRAPSILIENFTPKQIGDGLAALINLSVVSNAMIDVTVPRSLQLECISAIPKVFEDIFVFYCEETKFAHLDEIVTDETDSIRNICYMWWDYFPTWGDPDDPQRKEIDNAVLAVLERILQFDNDACIESALHGLGHWQLNYPDRAGAIVDKFLTRVDGKISENLLNYAREAREGIVL